MVREFVQSDRIKLVKIASKDNIADLLTKVLDRVPFESLRKLLMQLVRVGASVVGRKKGVD